MIALALAAALVAASPPTNSATCAIVGDALTSLSQAASALNDASAALSSSTLHLRSAALDAARTRWLSQTLSAIADNYQRMASATQTPGVVAETELDGLTRRYHAECTNR